MVCLRFTPAPPLGAGRGSAFAVLILCVCLCACTGSPTGGKVQSVHGEITRRAVIDCFEAGLITEEGTPVYCEASAIVFDGQSLIIASDKPVPGMGRSAVFSFPYPGSGEIEGEQQFLDQAPFVSAIKYEDMTITPDGRHIIATTGFDRIKGDSNEWDGYNTVLFWPVGDPDSVRLVSPSSSDGVASSVSLRNGISRALLSDEFPDEVPYFKVESLAAIPGNKLLFGIRELGVKYDQFMYTFKILSVAYQLKEGDLLLTGDFELVYDFDSANQAGTQQSSALSSIEYDAYHDQLYLLTSYENGETDEDIGGYLWTLPLSGLASGRAPERIRTVSGEALSFAHKSEGITVLDEHLLMVIHDDDRVLGREAVENPETQFSRAAHQAAYSLVSLETARAN